MNEQQTRVNSLIERIERHQAALRLKDYPFAARYQRHLGSGKSWVERLKARNWAELGKGLDKWERKLNAFVAELDTGSGGEEFFESLPIVGYIGSAFQMLSGQRNDRRCVLIIGPTGVGKSVALQRLATANPQQVVYLRFWKGMSENLRLITAAFCRVLHCPVETSNAATFENVIASLRGSPLTVIIEDAHEGGVLALKLVKTLIDETRAKFMLSVYPTSFRRLINGGTEAMAEAQQLLGRTIKPVNQQWLKGVTVSDVAAFLRASGILDRDAAVSCAKNMTAAIRTHGNLRLLADAIELARINADETGEEFGTDYIEAAAKELCRQYDDDETQKGSQS